MPESGTGEVLATANDLSTPRVARVKVTSIVVVIVT